MRQFLLCCPYLLQNRILYVIITRVKLCDQTGVSTTDIIITEKILMNPIVIENTTKLIGGLALFLFGMSLMGDSLKKVAGSKLEPILEKLTSNKLKGVLLGTVVTAAIQSSSATTVMVVGFVNSGIMKLTQAIGIIMGANIGTTATGWVLSLSGLNGSGNVWASIISPAVFTPVIAAFGICFYMFTKNKRTKNVALVLLGFAILMFGMQMMSAAVAPMKDSQSFRSLLTLFGNNPVLSILVGIVVTAIIQSSSASVGILQAMTVTGTITYQMALPLILGMNIGANKNGKRAAFIYLYFNVIGTLIFMAVYYLIKLLVPMSFLDNTADFIGVAIVNTIYKVFSVIVLLPFTKLLEKLVYITVPDGKGKGKNEAEDKIALLDERFLRYPPLAIERCRSAVNFMADEARTNLLDSIDLIGNYSRSAAQSITEKEDIIDSYEDKLGTYLVKLSSVELSPTETRDVSKLLHSIGDIERIGDHAINIMETAEEIKDKNIVFSPEAQEQLDRIANAIREIVNNTIECFKNNDIELAKKIEPLEEVIDILRDDLKQEHIERVQRGECTLDIGFVFNDIIDNYERIADHCSNIAVAVIRLNDEKFDTHEYLGAIKDESGEFNKMFEYYKGVYIR